MTTRRIVRCTEGHPYDANAHEGCPVCGAAREGLEAIAPAPAPVPPLPPPQKRGWVTAAVLGGAVLIAVGAGVIFHLHKPAHDMQPAKHDDLPANGPGAPPAAKQPDTSAATKAEAEKQAADKAQAEEAAKAEAAKAEAARTAASKAAAREAADKVRADEAAKADADKAEAARAARAKADAARADEAAKAEAGKAEAAKAEAERQATDPRVTQFMMVDQATVQAMRRVLAPVEPADSNTTLDAVAPPIERRLRLSTFLREILANERAVQALKARDYTRMKTILSAIVSLPPVAPGIVSLAAHKNLAMYFAREGAPPRDLAHAAQLTMVSVRGGFPSAVMLLMMRPGLVEQSGLDAVALAPFLRGAVIQDPQMLEPFFRKHDLPIDKAQSTWDSFEDDLSRRDWPAAVSLLQQYGDLRLPVFDMLLSQALILAPNNAGFMDRALVGAVSGGAASYSVGTDLLGYFCLEGLDGVTRDDPNAAGWLIATLFGLPKDDTAWAGSRERYQRAKGGLPPDQRQAIEQLAREFGVE